MTAGTGASRGVRRERRAEMLAGYALIAVPMLFFLTCSRGDPLRRSTSASGAGACAAPREFLGLDNFEEPVRPDLLQGASATRSTTP